MLTLNIVVAAALAAQVHPRELMALLAWTVTVLVAMSLVLLVVDPASAVSTPDRPGIFIPGELYGVFSHKVSLGTYAAIALLVLLFSPEDFPSPLTRWGSILICTVGLLFSNSASSIVALAVASALLAATRRFPGGRAAMFGATVFVVVAISIALPFVDASSVAQAFGRPPTLTGRTSFWSARPGLHHGAPLLRLRLCRLLRPDPYSRVWDLWAAAEWFFTPNFHNSALDVTIALGFVGLAAYLAAAPDREPGPWQPQPRGERRASRRRHRPRRGRLGDRLPAHAPQRAADRPALLCLPGRRAALCHDRLGGRRTMSATQPAFARSGEEMTPPATLADRAKHTVLRKVVDRLRPLAYRRGAGGIRCLTFHYLFDHERERADRLFRALKREGDFVTTAELLAALEGAPPRSERLLHLSIDDGFQNIAAVAHPILKRLGIPYSLMVCPSFVGGGAEALDRFRRNARYARPLPLADWDALARLAADGVEIGAHTLTHRELSRLSGDELREEIAAPKAIIERRLGRPCTSFAWPFGRSTAMSEEGLAIAHEAGYRAVFSSLRGTLEPGRGVPVYLPRHHFEPSWPLDTVVYYATRAEPVFAPQPLAGHGR